MRILVVGAGIAGLTLASLLRRQGTTPMVIDTRPPEADLGYGLALWPQGSRVLHALDLHGPFVAESEPMRRYTLRNGFGRLITSFDIPSAIRRFGELGIISRPTLIALLERALGSVDIRRRVSIAALSGASDRVETRLTDETEGSFDLVVGADGIHSRTRELLFGRLPERDIGWSCCVWWSDGPPSAQGETTEWWGAGHFLGTYPGSHRVCVVAGAPTEVLEPDEGPRRLERLRAMIARCEASPEELLSGLSNEASPFLWRMADVRAPRWVDGRVVLVGDAAAAFLPTAGIGASMALESAAVLADELSRTDAKHLPNALDLYVKRRRARVEAAQEQSRLLARLSFVKTRPMALLRDQAMRFFSMERMLAPIVDQLKAPI